MYFINVNISQHVLLDWTWTWKSQCRCFTWILFIELNFRVAFLLLRKLLMTDSPVMWGDGRFEEMEGRILAMGRWGNDFEMRGKGWDSFTDYAVFWYWYGLFRFKWRNSFLFHLDLVKKLIIYMDGCDENKINEHFMYSDSESLYGWPLLKYNRRT